MLVVTGGAGFIGSAFIWYLNRQGLNRILVVDRLKESEKWKNLAKLKFFDFLHKDDFLSRLKQDKLPELEAVVHLGACSDTTEKDADYLLQNNFAYSKEVAGYCLKKGIRLVYASSAATYGDGSEGFDDEMDIFRLKSLNMYAYSKQLFDMWLEQKGLLGKVAGLKFFNVFGPNEYHKKEMRSMVCKAFEQVQATGRIRLFKSYRQEFGHGEQKRDFLYIKDCVRIMYDLLFKEDVCGLFNVGSGRANTWNDLAQAVFEGLGQKPDIEYIDMPEGLKEKYQYLTQAKMDKLARTGVDTGCMGLSEGVKDYLSYLTSKDPYLERTS